MKNNEEYLIIVHPNQEEKRGIASVHYFIVPMLHKWALYIEDENNMTILHCNKIGINTDAHMCMHTIKLE